MSNLETFFEQFEEWVLKDIKIVLELVNKEGNSLAPDRRVVVWRRPLVAGVILICCAIDTLAAFRYGRTNNNVGTYFMRFVRDYFAQSRDTRYNDEQIYKGLRNALLHGYSLGSDLALSHTSASRHLTKEANKIVIDVFSLQQDLEKVYSIYKSELKNGQHIPEFNDRWNYAPLIQYFPDIDLKLNSRN
ncbi:MAG: hypothetical protein WC528_01605 [Patescibacteria group bacterium]